MLNYLLAAVLGLGLSFGLCRFLIKLAKRRQLFILPIRPRDEHQLPTPRVGGLAIVATFLIVIFFWQCWRPGDLSFTGSQIWGIDRNLFGLILAIILLSAVNAYDDKKGVHYLVKLLAQIVAAVLVALFGIHIPTLTNPLGGQILIGSLGFFLVVLWLVTVTNVVNWLDGVDGLSGGVSAISLFILFFLSISQLVNQAPNALLATIAFGAVIGFLPFNLIGRRAFLGDVGSNFLGFLIGVLAIISGGKLATAFLVLAIPFLDALVVIINRLIRGQSPFKADRRHLHHQLLALGLRPYQVVLVFYAVSLLFGLIALNTQTTGKVWAALAAALLMMILVLLYSVGRKETNNDRNSHKGTF